MALHERGQLAGDIVVAAALKVGVDAVLEARDPQLLEMVALGRRERLRELGQRRSAPDRERLAQARGRLLRLPRLERDAPLAPQPVEPHAVDRLRIDLHEVAGRSRDEHAARQRLAQLRDVDVDHLHRAAGHGRAPQVVHQPIDRHRPVGVEQQPRQQGPLPQRADVHRHAAFDHLERPEETELHPRPTLSARWEAGAPGPREPL
jgi:hypothetical protein